jgi:hypothetical protein
VQPLIVLGLFFMVIFVATWTALVAVHHIRSDFVHRRDYRSRAPPALISAI